MGMFDTITSRYALPLPPDLKGLSSEEIQSRSFQTKSLDCCFSYYLIKEDGSLWELPDTEPATQIELTTFNGDIEFYDIINKSDGEYDYWIEFRFTFLNGKLITSALVKYDAYSNAERKANELRWKNEWKVRRELWDRWYMKYLYKYYDTLVHRIFRLWNRFSKCLPSSYKVERFFRPL